MSSESSKLRPEKVKFMLMAANMNRAVKFYLDVIGLRSSSATSGPSCPLAMPSLPCTAGTTGSKNPTGLSLQFEDVFEAANRIEAGGAKMIEPPVQREGEPMLFDAFRDRERGTRFTSLSM